MKQIIVKDKVYSGKPCLANTRIPLSILLAEIFEAAEKNIIPDICEDRDLDEQQVLAALSEVIDCFNVRNYNPTNYNINQI